MQILDDDRSKSISRATLKHSARWSPDKDRWTFFSFFLVGAGSILTLKLLVDSQLVVTSVPCTLMLAYGALVWNFRERQPRSDSAGDNLYYLGFLYTLTSLAHSLYRFSGDKLNTDVIITNFGVAISTTILGMSLRVLLSRPAVDDPSALDQSARLDLAETARKLRREMSYTVETFREALEQDLDGVRRRLVHLAAETEEASSSTVNRMRALGLTGARLSDALNEASGRLLSRTQELGESAAALTAVQESILHLDSRARDAVTAIEDRTTGLAVGTESIREALVAQAAQVNSVDLRELLRDAIEVASTDIEAAAKRTTSRVNSRIDSMLKLIEARLEELSATSEALQESLREQAARIQAVDFQQAFVDHAVVPASKELGAAAEEFKGLLDKLGKADAARERALASSADVAATIRESLNGQENLSRTVLDALQNARVATDSLRRVSDQLVRSIDGAQEVAHRISLVSDGLADSSAQIRVFNEDLTNASATLRSRLQTTKRSTGVRRWFKWLRSPRA